MAQGGLLDRLAQSSSNFKAGLTITATTCILVLSGLSGCAVGNPPAATPAAGVTGTGLEPTEGPIGTPTAGREVGLSPTSRVSTYPVTPDQAHLSPSATAVAAVDAGERLGTRTAIPTQPSVPASVSPTPTPQVVADSESPESTEVVARATDTRGPAQAATKVTGSPEKPAATRTLEPSPPPAETPTTPQPGNPVGKATTQLNIRGGPGTGYPILGLLEPDQSVEITGVSSDGGWWQIRFTNAAGESAWVSAGYITARNTENVPIVQPPALPLTPVQVTAWRGEYFSSRDLAGSPALVRDDPDVNFDWAAGAPAAGLPVDDFSVRWTRSLDFSAASYRFYLQADDGVRLWIDGELVIDQWHEAAPTTYTADTYLAEGKHQLSLEYYEHTGNAVVQLNWDQFEDFPDWRGEYYDNPSLSGAPILVRNDPSIDFNWDLSPGPGVPADNFSARWTRTLYFPAYVYRFSLVVDDGARLWVDDRLIIDGWRAGPPVDFTAEIGLSEGPHNMRLEYFEFRYGAQLHLNWLPVQDGPTWKAEYYDNHRLGGDPVLERDDGVINFIWGTGSPGPDVPADNFSVRWTQDVEFEDGVYLFSVWVDDGVRLWVDDVRLIDSWEEGRVRLYQAERQLSSGTHRVKVEYFERTGHAQIEVSWERK